MAALQALVSLVAHDFRNALNAVAVNLDVVRGRLARGAEAPAIAPFAATAVAQFEAVSAAAEALLALSRSEPPGPADVATVTARVARLLTVRADGVARLTLPSSGPAPTSVPPEVVRALVAHSVLSALATGGAAACEITVADGILLRVSGAESASPVLDPGLVAVASSFAVAVATRDHAIELRFPSSGTDAIPDGPA